MLAGMLENMGYGLSFAWSVTFGCMSVIFIALFVYHFFVLPRPEINRAKKQLDVKQVGREFVETFATFFRKKNVVVAIAFMLLYRFPEAQLTKIVMPFLVDPTDKGGLALSTVEIGFVYGTIGVIGLVLGGIVGGMAASVGGLKKWLWPMALAITLPDIVFVVLSHVLPSSLIFINICVFIEQFGYGFGFAAYMLYMIYFSEGEHSTAHYAICTAFMTLGLMLPGMFAGWLQEKLGYEMFFCWVMGCCLLTLFVTSLIKIDPDFGKKKA
jgi:PAT family beta-lactamase induction signal transducer AmpG